MLQYPAMILEKRYARHLVLPEVGAPGQERLKRSSVLVVGAGGLGSPVLLYLAAAGVGRLGVADPDSVEESNLQRQVLFGASTLGRPKAEAARERLADLNPEVSVRALALRLDAENAPRTISEYDLVVDATDNLASKSLLGEACFAAGKPLVYGAVHRFEGRVSVFLPGRGPCYRCLHPGPDSGPTPGCAQAGVLGVLPGVIGSLQAAESLKLLLGSGEPLSGRLLVFDALSGTFTTLRFPRDPACPLCGRDPETKEKCMPEKIPEISVEELKAKIDRKERIVILDVREKNEHEFCRIPGSTLIPLGELPKRLSELDPQSELVVHCRSGGRSAQAVSFLRGKGFAKAVNVAGGILAWSNRIDPSVPTY